MKKWVLIMSLILGVAMLAACGNKEKDDDKQEVSLADVHKQIKDVIVEDLKNGGFAEPVVDGKLLSYLEIDLTDPENPDRDFYLEKLGIQEEQLQAGYVIAALMNINSDEIILLEAKDETAAASLKTALEKELAAQTQTWSQYLPDQFEKVKNNIIKQNGNKLIYITYDHPDKMAEIFDAKTK
ncbi:DUF4358 domain-containing protein [Bacillus sp. Bva_UNVM-123]|uniref:DUF4358 domain-containing protein n=1 Tax=Bacillus sp. Bva_UNVM-123 TaxID=2829798 RepID=UPI00391FB73B